MIKNGFSAVNPTTWIKTNCLFLSIEYNKTSDGWIVFNGSQYFINTDQHPMEEARAFCKKNHADLAVMTGETERKFIWKQVNDGQWSLCLKAAYYATGMKIHFF